MATRISMKERPAQIPCNQCPLQDCASLRPLTAEQLAFTWSLKSGELHLERGGHIVVQGSISPHLYTQLTGVSFRFKMMEDGRRQIVNFLFPGDLVGLQGAREDPLSHGVEALTDIRLCVFPRHRILDVFREHPELGFDMTWLAAKEETALDEHLLALGQRKADERIAYLALFLLQRGRSTGLARGNRFSLSLTQTQIADTLGLSVVHTNKVLQSLRRRQMLDWRPDAIVIKNMDRVMELASFDLPEERNRPFI